MIKILIATLIAGSNLFAGTYRLKPIHITKDITCVIGDFNPPNKENKGFVSNMCYVNMGDSLVVLDAGPTYHFAKEFYALMQEEYPHKKISHVVLSNYHDDRIQGASFFKDLGAHIVGGKAINEDIQANPQKFERMKMLYDEEILQSTKVIPADTLVGNGYKIQGSAKTLEILKLSPVSEEKSDIAVYSRDDSFLFVGNIVFNGRMLNYTKHSQVDGWIQALEKIASLKAKYVLGGHGNEYHKEAYKASLEYLKILKNSVKKGFDKDLEREDITIGNNSYKTKKIPYYSPLNRNNINNYYDQLEWAE